MKHDCVLDYCSAEVWKYEILGGDWSPVKYEDKIMYRGGN